MKCKRCGEGYDAVEVDRLYGDGFSLKGFCRPFCYSQDLLDGQKVHSRVAYSHEPELAKTENACANQLNKIDLNDCPRFKFQTDEMETKWIELNLDTLTALNAWLGRPYVLRNLIDKFRRK